MKVLFITHHLKGNDGWSRYARDTVLALKAQGVTTLSLVNELSPETAAPQKVCLEGPLGYVANPLRSWATARRIQKIITEFSPDIIHVIVESYGTMLPFLDVGQAKLVFTAHSTYAYMPILVSGMRRLISRILSRRMYARTDMVICVSAYTARHLERHMAAEGSAGLVENKIKILAGGVDISHVQNHGSKEARQPNQKKEILFVGAIKPRKGVKEAIDALAHVKSDFIYRIVGSYKPDDPYVLLLKSQIEKNGLQGKVVFAGSVTDERLSTMYDTADLYLMLSTNNGADFEGYGLVYIEANAHGVPCIGPKDSGVAEAIVDGKTGYLVDQYDAKAVAEKVDHILINHPIRTEDCLAFAAENSTEKKGQAMLALYKGL